MRHTDGQSTVEVIGLLPLLLAVGLGAFALLSAGAAREAASGAAEAGAVALLQGRDGRAAARAALPGWPRARTRIAVAGRRVTVSVTPSGPLGARLRATASADAGPSAAGGASPPAGGSRSPSAPIFRHTRRSPSPPISGATRRAPSSATSGGRR